MQRFFRRDRDTAPRAAFALAATALAALTLSVLVLLPAVVETPAADALTIAQPGPHPLDASVLPERRT